MRRSEAASSEEPGGRAGENEGKHARRATQQHRRINCAGEMQAERPANTTSPCMRNTWDRPGGGTTCVPCEPIVCI